MTEMDNYRGRVEEAFRRSTEAINSLREIKLTLWVIMVLLGFIAWKLRGL
jgi:hypothetical protein